MGDSADGFKVDRVRCTASGVAWFPLLQDGVSAKEGVRWVKATRMRRASSEEELQWGRRVECPKTGMNCLQAPLPCVPPFQNVHRLLGNRIPGGPFSGETNPEFGQGSDPHFSPWLHCRSSHGDWRWSERACPLRDATQVVFPAWDWPLEVLWRGSPPHTRSMGMNGVHRKVTTKVRGAGVWRTVVAKICVAGRVELVQSAARPSWVWGVSACGFLLLPNEEIGFFL
ncbi:hypothetical protein DFH09DRAFT_1096820 [Mycena vulgaris]|nr:hypothetical protein DFH09DRAFT_1096820 [Mycena vulgaris]